MTITRITSLTLLFVLGFCLNQENLFAQTPNSPFAVPDINNHEFHHKCGFDHVKENLMAEDPEFAEWVKNTKENVAEMVANHQNMTGFVLPPIIDIPVVVHVIHQGEAEGVGPNLSVGQIEAQIAVLNEAFSATNVNFAQTPAQWQNAIGNPEMNFCLAVIDPNGNASNGITRHNMDIISQDNIENVIKPATWWNSNLYYNIWTVGIPGTTAGGGTTGYAYLPFNGTIGTPVDGSVVDWRWFGGPGYGQSGDGTLTHETGHYLGLFHTFDGTSCTDDDGLADTPNIDDATSAYQPGLNCSTNNFPTGPSSCGNEHMYVNYMDYVNDDFCSTSFSNDQITVMRAVMNGTSSMFGSRLALANNATAVCTFFGDDCGVNDINAPGSLICDAGQITPEVEIQNFGQNTLTSATISYEINGGTPVDFTWTGNLLTGESETVVLAPYAPPAGNYTFTAYTQLPNGNADGQMTNDTMSTNSASINPLSLPLFEDMEDPAWNPTTNGVFVFNITGDPFEWQRTTEASAFGNGGACAMFDNFEGSGASNPGGTIDALVTPIYDFSNVTGASLTFDVAYTYFSNGGQSFTDTLIVLVSTNCGQNYITQLYVKGGEELSTAPPVGFPFTPTATQWRTETVDLSAYDGEDNLSITFVNFSEWGNRLFIDNINIATACGLNSSTSNLNPTCFGVCDGIASVVGNGGTGNYTYQWDANAGNATTPTVTDLCAGTYSVTVSDGPGCTSENTVVITEPIELGNMADVQPVYCPDLCDGVINQVATGGTMPYAYQWSNGATTDTIMDLCPGPYALTITDGNGCTFTFDLAVPDLSTMELTVSSTPLSAPGANDATATATATGGSTTYNYAWSNSGTTQTITALAPGTYTVTVTEEDFPFCSLTETVVIDDIDCTGFGAIVTTTDETGLGANDGTATANPTGGVMPYTYVWSNTESTQTITGLTPATYSVTVSDANGCTVIASGTVNAFVPDCSNFDFIVENVFSPSCFGECDGFITLNVVGGTMPYSYDWSDDLYDGFEDPINMCAGTYTVTVSDANGCSDMQTITINESAPPLEWQTVTTFPSCNGDCTGTIDLSVNGGVTPYAFNWSNGATSEDLEGLCADEYAVTIVDANGCIAIQTITISEPAILSVTTSMTPVSGAGTNDGTATATPTGGTPAYTYAWSNSETTPSISNLSPGTYTVTVTDVNGCTENETIVINPFDCGDFNATLNVFDATCFQQCDGFVDLVVVGGTMPYEYDWNVDIYDGMEDIFGLCAGTYEVTISDATSCSVVLVANVLEAAPLSVTLNSTPPSAPGANDASITATASGGVPTYGYLWSPGGETTPTISNLAPGTYSVVVTDQNGCTEQASTTITDVDCSNFIISISTSDVSCDGSQDGIAVVTALDGVEPYTYIWSTGDMTDIVTGLEEGTISVTVVDGNGCQLDAVDMIGSPLPIEIEFETVGVSCNGDNDGAITCLPSGGTPGGVFDYSWSNGSGDQTISALPAGIYCVTVTDIQSGCTAENCATIVELPVLVAAVTVVNESMPGANDGSATCTASGGTPGYTYEWCNGETTETATGLAGGVCLLIVTDANGCTTVEEVLIGTGTVDCSSFGMAVSFTEPLCFGDENGTATATPSGGTMPYSYLWSNGETTGTIVNLLAGPYSCLVTDANGCQLEQSFDLPQPSEIIVTITSTNETTPGASDGTATVSASGGTPGYTYLWCDGQTTAMAIGLAAGACEVVVTDINGCTTIASVTIETDAIDCSNFAGTIVTTDLFCNGDNTGSASAFATGGTEPYTYLWSTSETTSSIFGLAVGIYSCEITDAAGCEFFETFEILEPAPIIITTTSTDQTSTGANDGTAECFPTGGIPPYTFEWCNGSTAPVATGLPAGACTVTVTDANGCTAIETVVIGTATSDCSSFSAALSVTEVDCFGNATGVITAFPQGGNPTYNYAWNTGESTQSIINLVAGLYEVTITDANNCEIILEGVVTEPMALLSAASSTPESAAGANDGTASANPIGGTPPYAFNWSNGGTTETITNLMPGSYSVIVTDTNGCITESGTFVGTGNVDCSSIGLAIATENVSCFDSEDGVAIATVTGGTAPYGYLWNTGATTEVVTNLPPGPYSVTISDVNGCQLVESFAIAQPTELVVGATSTDETTAGANDGTAAAAASGGTPGYTYMWDNGATTAMIVDLAPGIYSVTATDANGCTETMITIVAVGNVDCAGIDLNVTAEGASCFGGNDGSATANVTGGVGPYTYTWDNGGTTATINNLTPGFYNVTIVDAVGCALGGAIVVDQPVEIVTSTQGIDGACGGSASAQVFATGGTSPFSYLWSNGETSNFIGGLNSGIYSVTVTDAMGCTTVDQVQVQVNSEGIILDYETDAISCFGETDGGIDLAVLLGTPPFSFEWSNGATTEDLIGIEAGVYTVLIVDAAGCNLITSFEVPSPAELTIDIETTPADSGTNGTAAAFCMGGTSPYTYDWSTGNQTILVDGLGVGTYSVVVTDANGCTAMQTTTIGTTAVDDIESLTSFNLYPNPSDGYFQLEAEFAKWEELDVEIYSVVGQLVFAQRVTGTEVRVEVDIRDAAKGTYILRMSGDGGRLIRKIMVR